MNAHSLLTAPSRAVVARIPFHCLFQLWNETYQRVGRWELQDHSWMDHQGSSMTTPQGRQRASAPKPVCTHDMQALSGTIHCTMLLLWSCNAMSS